MSQARYSIVHETSYVYESRVAVAQQLLHLTPRELPWQRRLAHRIAIDPVPSETTEHQDYFGNAVCHAVLDSPHDSLTVRAESEVSVGWRTGGRVPAGSPAWESVRDILHTAAEAVQLEAAEFLFESPHIRFGAGLVEYVSPSFPPGRAYLEGVLDLNRRIHADFAFDSSATSVSTPIAEVLALRRGVCQDFAHLMTGCLRVIGLPARYVSGYILTMPAPGHVKLVGADASHAWVSVYCPHAGWVDFDPTNDLVVDDEHITLAWGRDFSDVAPMRGVILGGGEQELEVHVTVMPLGEPTVPGRTQQQWQEQEQAQQQAHQPWQQQTQDPPS
jgi:transglutaminase-like putative cysteine protease